jgi:hypothetical protein
VQTGLYFYCTNAGRRKYLLLRKRMAMWRPKLLVFKVHVEVFWTVTPCIVVGYQRFRGPWRLHDLRNLVTLPQYCSGSQLRRPRLETYRLKSLKIRISVTSLKGPPPPFLSDEIKPRWGDTFYTLEMQSLFWIAQPFYRVFHMYVVGCGIHFLSWRLHYNAWKENMNLYLWSVNHAITRTRNYHNTEEG